MYRIKCNNGLYVAKTTYGTWLSFTKKGKIFKSEYLVKKNLELCHKFVENDNSGKYKHLTFRIEEL